MKVIFDVGNIHINLLVKLPSSEKLAKYKEDLANVKDGETKPTPPEFGQYKPLELVEMVCNKAISVSSSTK